MHNTTFDNSLWLQKFKAASAQKAGFKELRLGVFMQTVEIVNSGGYVLGGKEIAVDKSGVADNTEFFDVRFSLGKSEHLHDTRFSVIEADCLEVAALLLKAGFNPCVLNMASGQNPGGGVLKGSGAQEENLFRRSNLFASLYQFAGYAAQYGVAKSEKQYPLDENFGGIYSGDVTVFRSSESSGYTLLDAPFQTSVVSVAAIRNPELTKIDGKMRIARHLTEQTKEKIRTILRIAGKYNHNALVLSAFGCGAYCNPPEHIALLFRSVFAEAEFHNRFALVVFAIINDNNSNSPHNPNGNFEPFRKIF